MAACWAIRPSERHRARLDHEPGTLSGDRPPAFESRKKRSVRGDEQPPAEAAADPHDPLELRDQAQSLRAALQTLTPDERLAIETTFFAELTHTEAAVRLNQPLGTIKTRIRSGLQKLRSVLTGEAEKP